MRFFHSSVMTWGTPTGGGPTGGLSMFGDGSQQWQDVDWRLPKPSQSSENVVNVSSNSALQSAISSASPGDTITITSSGTYNSALSFEGVNGTAANPIIVTAATGVAATIKSDGGIYSFGFGEATGTSASYIYVGNFQGDTGKIIATGLKSDNTTYRDNIMWFGNKDNNGSNFGLVHHIYITGVEAVACKGAMVDIARESSYIEFHGCEFHDADGAAYGGANPQFCEIFYIGSSATKTTNYGRGDGSHHITIKGCEIHDFTGEAIDNKSGSGTHDITIEDTLIYNGNIYNQTGSTVTVGAVVTGSDDTSYFASGAHNFVIQRCAMWDIQLAAGTGAQIAAGISMQAPATVDTVVIWNTQDEGIRIRDLVSGKVAGDEYVVNNVTIFNTGGTDSIEEYADAGSLTSYLTITDAVSTIGTTKGTQTNNYDPVSGDFQGPLTNDAVASGFTDPGTGHRLAGSSSIPATAGAFA